MSEQPQPQPQRMQQTMPEDGGGWHHVDAGPHLQIMFHPNRIRPEPDDIERPSIVVAVAGKREQALRFDPFSVGSHYHIRPSLRGRQLPLWVEEGQKPLEIALAFFEKPLRFRGLLAQAEEDDVASQLDDADLASAARQIPGLLRRRSSRACRVTAETVSGASRRARPRRRPPTRPAHGSAAPAGRCRERGALRAWN